VQLRKIVSITAMLMLLGVGRGVSAGDQPVGASCGGIAGKQCGAGLYCNFRDGTALAPSSCGQADQTGTCSTVPQECPQNSNPVCGCDGKTYDNACKSHTKGVTVAKPGKCSMAAKSSTPEKNDKTK
jgi:hypothetical protein